MLKRFLTYAGMFLLLTGISAPAKADIEAIQGAVMGPIQTVLQEAKAIQEDLNEIKAELRSAAEGVAGPIKEAAKTVNDAKDKVQSGIEMTNNVKADPLATMGNKMPGFLGDLDVVDQEKLQEAIKGNYLMQMPKAVSDVRSAVGDVTSAAASATSKINSVAGKASAPLQNGLGLPKTINKLDKGAWLDADEGVKTASYRNTQTLMFGAGEVASDTDLVKISREQEEKMSAMQRENFANLYAQAFTIRTNIAKENAEEADAKKKENSRDIIQATKEQSLEMAKRLRKFLIMEAAVYEFKASQQARQFAFSPEEDDDE